MVVKTIEASFEIVTPMFISGEDDKADLRPPSIKGALRFWWRALHWGQCLQEKGNEPQALELLYKREAELFGAAVKDKKYGQGVFAIKLKDTQVEGVEKHWPKDRTDSAAYIGYGIDKPSKTLSHQEGIKPQNFSIELILRKCTDIQQQQLKDSLLAWGLFGGLGARARRAFGSVALIKMDGVSYAFDNKTEYFQQINKFINSIVLAPNMPLFTAFNEGMKVSYLGKQKQKYTSIMDDLSNYYKETAYKELESTFDRAIYGLPRKDVDTVNRRSSPLLFHVHKLGEDYIGIFTFIPASFHHIKKHREKLPLFKKVTNFMDSMESIYS